MEQYAVVETGGKQYKVHVGDKIDVEKLDEKEGGAISLDRVLLLSDGKDVRIGTPYLNGAKVVCGVLAQVKDKKKITFKFRRRKSSHRKIGHRQKLTRIQVKEIKNGS